MSFTRQDLADMNKLWGDSGDGGPGADEVPEAQYQAKVKSATLMKSSSGRPQCEWKFKIIGGEEKAIGKVLTVYDGLESPTNMMYFKKKLKRLQLAVPTEFEEIPELLAAAVGAEVNIQVKYKDDFLNIYINKLLKAGDGEGEGEKEEDDDEKPAKPAKGAKKPDKDEEEEDEKDEDEDEEKKPAKGKTADKDDEKDEEEEEDEKPAKKDEEEEDEKEEASRNFPTQAELDKASEKGIRKVLKEFKLSPAEGKKEALLRGVAKALVAIMEDDDYEAPAGDLRVACKWLGVTPTDDQSVKKMTKQLIEHLSGN